MKPLLLTAGATRNRVDAIRYLSAFAGGQTALSILSDLPETPVYLLGSGEAVLRARLAMAERALAGEKRWSLQTEEFTGTRDLMGRMERWIRGNPYGVVVHSAAVGDYEAEPNASKIPSGQPEISIRLRPGPKIVDHVKDWAPECKLVSFKAGKPGLKPVELEQIAKGQLLRTESDLVFANVLGEIETSVLLVERERTRAFNRRTDAIKALVETLKSWL